MRPETIKEILNIQSSNRKLQNYLDDMSQIAKRHHQNPFYLKDGETFINQEVRRASKFKLDRDTVMPIIVGIDRNRDRVYTLNAGRRYTNTGTDSYKTDSSQLMVSGMIAGESRDKINRQFFSDGLDLDNFEILNFPGMGIEAVKHGAILPLNSRQGIFLPPFVDFALNMSIERETATDDRDFANSLISNEELFEEEFQDKYGFNLNNLLYYDFNRKLTANELTGRRFFKKSSVLVKSYRDPTISGRGPVEIVYGTAPIANFLFANYLIDKMLLDNRVNPNQAAGNAAHINIGMRPKYFSSTDLKRNVNAYFAVAGYLVGSSMITKKRAQGDEWYYRMHRTSTSDIRVKSRGFYRTDKLYPSGVLELRYPHNYVDSAYISNQVIIANKIASDIHNISSEQLPSGLITRGRPIRNVVEDFQSSPEYIEWVGKNILGFQNETQLEWYKKAVKQCQRIR